MTWFHDPEIETLPAAAPLPESEPDPYGEWLADEYEPGEAVEFLSAEQREELEATLAPDLSAVDQLKATRVLGEGTYVRAKLITAKLLVDALGPEWPKHAAARRALSFAEEQLRTPCIGVSETVRETSMELLCGERGDSGARIAAWFVWSAASDSTDLDEVDEVEKDLDGYEEILKGVDSAALRLALLLEL